MPVFLPESGFPSPDRNQVLYYTMALTAYRIPLGCKRNKKPARDSCLTEIPVPAGKNHILVYYRAFIVSPYNNTHILQSLFDLSNKNLEFFESFLTAKNNPDSRVTSISGPHCHVRVNHITGFIVFVKLFFNINIYL